MTSARSAPVAKTAVERHYYIETNIRPVRDPTLETVDAPDTTDTPLSVSTRQTSIYTPREREEPSPLLLWVQRNWFPVLVLPLLGWLALQIYSLNREVGVMSRELRSVETTTKEYKEDGRRELDQIHTRLDRMEDSTRSGDKSP